ncbi:hypothetical protein Tco_0641976 [Tanacetum coccineum]
MHNMRKTIGELHALYEKGLPKKAVTLQAMAIQGGRIQKANKKSLNAKGKGKGKGQGKDKSYIPKPKNPKPYAKKHLENDDAGNHCKEVGYCKRNYPAYLAELIKKKKQVGTASNGVRAQVEAIGSDDLVLPNGLVMCLDNCHYAPTITRGVVSVSRLDYALETATHILNMVPTKKVDKTPYELWYGKIPNLSYLNIWGCEALVKRDTPDKLQQRSVKCIFIGYLKEMMGYYFYFPPENKIVVARYAEFLEKNLISQEVSGRAEELEEIQDNDTSPSKDTNEIPMEV